MGEGFADLEKLKEPPRRPNGTRKVKRKGPPIKILGPHTLAQADETPSDFLPMELDDLNRIEEGREVNGHPSQGPISAVNPSEPATGFDFPSVRACPDALEDEDRKDCAARLKRIVDEQAKRYRIHKL
jgi:hypothetical protein